MGGIIQSEGWRNDNAVGGTETCKGHTSRGHYRYHRYHGEGKMDKSSEGQAARDLERSGEHLRKTIK